MNKTIPMAVMCVFMFGSVHTSVRADPPPWAPAHGYYKCKDEKRGHGKCKDKRKDRDRDDYAAHGPYISDGRCNREALGAVLGGVVGGVIGSQVGKGDNRTVATVAGTVIGVLIGRSIGRSMDDKDQACIGQALEYTADRQTISWRNPESGMLYNVTPTRTWKSPDGRYCRDYETEAVLNAQSRDVIFSSACRNQDATWKISPY